VSYPPYDQAKTAGTLLFEVSTPSPGGVWHFYVAALSNGDIRVGVVNGKGEERSLLLTREERENLKQVL